MAEWFLENYHIKTMGVHGIIYIYKNGVYQTCGEEFIHATVRKILGDATTSRRITEVVFMIKTQTYSEREDPPAEIVNTRSGLLNVITGELKPHDPRIFSTSQVPIRMIVDAKCPRVKHFITQIVKEDDVRVVQEILGFVLLGDYRIQKAVMFIGDGSNGKSTLIELIRRFLGKGNTSSIALQDLTTNDFARNRLYGKMANLFADLPDMALHNTGFFKMMTGGDSMYADIKFKEGFDFFNKAKLIFSCNKLPTAYDETDAFFRRWVFLNFPNKFEGEAANQNILDEIATEEEMSGLLNWALEGLTRLLKNKDFTNSRKTEEIRDYYERMSSPIAAFLNDKVSEEANGRVTKQELYRAFCTYCNANKLPIMSDNIFSRKLIQSFGHKITDGQETINGKRTRVWKGINCTGCTGCTGISSLKDNFHDIHENKDINGKRCVSRAGCADVVDKILTFIPIDGINYADLRKRTPDLDEAEFERLIDQLRADGSIYEDTPGHIRKVA
jgi:putative DNA primase/helicase